MPDLRLRKEERLISRKVLGTLFADGRTFAAFPLRFVWMTTTADGPFPVRAAFSVSRRRWKHAVDRNSYKRRMREAYRHHKHILYEPLTASGITIALVCIYTADSDCAFEHIQRAMSKGLQKLATLIQQQHPST